MNCYTELLKHRPDLAEKTACVIGTLNTRKPYDQIIYVDDQLMDAYGKPIGKQKIFQIYGANFETINPPLTVKEQA